MILVWKYLWGCKLFEVVEELVFWRIVIVLFDMVCFWLFVCVMNGMILMRKFFCRWWNGLGGFVMCIVVKVILFVNVLLWWEVIIGLWVGILDIEDLVMLLRIDFLLSFFWCEVLCFVCFFSYVLFFDFGCGLFWWSLSWLMVYYVI